MRRRTSSPSASTSAATNAARQRAHGPCSFSGGGRRAGDLGTVPQVAEPERRFDLLGGAPLDPSLERRCPASRPRSVSTGARATPASGLVKTASATNGARRSRTSRRRSSKSTGRSIDQLVHAQSVSPMTQILTEGTHRRGLGSASRSWAAALARSAAPSTEDMALIVGVPRVDDDQGPGKRQADDAQTLA